MLFVESKIASYIAKNGVVVGEIPDVEHIETATEGEDGLGVVMGLRNCLPLAITVWALAIGLVAVVWWGFSGK